MTFLHIVLQGVGMSRKKWYFLAPSNLLNIRGRIHDFLRRFFMRVHLCFFNLCWVMIGLLGAPMARAQSSNDLDFPYDLNTPNDRYELSKELEEVSGICMSPQGMLGMVQDEIGRVYVFNTETRYLENILHFRDKGDFEGIEIVGDTAYVLKSNGKLYELANFRSRDLVIRDYKTFLSEDNDTEGLGYDPKNHYLLIACKSSPSYEERSYKGNRAIYAFDLRSKQLLPEPYLLINRDMVESYTGKENQKFKPSGLALHPLSNDLYVIASAGQLMVVIDQHASIKWIMELEKKVLRQPEGICFAPDGTMYIASEGDGEDGYVLKFLPQKTQR